MTKVMRRLLNGDNFYKKSVLNPMKVGCSDCWKGGGFELAEDGITSFFVFKYWTTFSLHI